MQNVTFFKVFILRRWNIYHNQILYILTYFLFISLRVIQFFIHFNLSFFVNEVFEQQVVIALWIVRWRDGKCLTTIFFNLVVFVYLVCGLVKWHVMDWDDGLDWVPFVVAVRVIVYFTVILLLQFQHLLRLLLRIVWILSNFFVLDFFDNFRKCFGHIVCLALLVEECDIACFEIVGVELHKCEQSL